MKNAYLIKGAAPALQWVQFAEVLCRQFGTENYSLTAPAQTGDNLRIGGIETTVTAIPESDEECSGRYMVTVDPPANAAATDAVERQELVNPYAAHTNVITEQDGQGNAVYDILAEADPTLPGDTLIGGWEPVPGQPAKPITPLDLEAYKAIRPLGNSSDGSATSELKYAHWANESLSHRVLGDKNSPDPILQLYPAEDAPLAMEIRHWYFENPAAPAADGWGFHVEIKGGADANDPSVRSTGAYDDPEFTESLWPTVGAFFRGESYWQVDEAGDPIEVWMQDSWDGYRLDEQREWYIALLYSSIQEGRATLPVDSDGITYLFWQQNQPPPPGTGQWVDTGQTVGFASGDVLRIQSTVGFSVGDLLRVDGTELTVKTVHNSIDLLCNETTTGLPTGAAVERYESVSARREGRVLLKAWTIAELDAFSTINMTRAEKDSLRGALLSMGVANAHIKECGALRGRVAHIVVLLRFLAYVIKNELVLPRG